MRPIKRYTINQTSKLCPSKNKMAQHKAHTNFKKCWKTVCHIIKQ